MKMDVIKEYVESINLHWIAVVTTGLYIHLRQMCFIGFCFDEDNSPPFDTSYASIIFIFSALCLLAEYKLWPRSLKEPSIQLLIYIYEILVAALVTNLTMRVIWNPLMHGIWCLTQEASNWLLWLNSMMGFQNYSYLKVIADYMGKDIAAAHTAFCLSLLSFVWMLDATESLDGIFDLITKNKPIYSIRVTGNKVCKRITFKNPEVSEWFFYTLYRN